MSQAIMSGPGRVEGPPVHYLNAERGVLSWLTTVDHKRIGLMSLVSTLFFFADARCPFTGVPAACPASAIFRIVIAEIV